MATRAEICFYNLDKSLDIFYCHNDGKVEVTGKRLFDFFSDDKVFELHNTFKLYGDVSALRPDINQMIDEKLFYSLKGHKNVQGYSLENVSSLFDYCKSNKISNDDIEYFYFYDYETSTWYVYNKWINCLAPLSEALAKSKNCAFLYMLRSLSLKDKIAIELSENNLSLAYGGKENKINSDDVLNDLYNIIHNLYKDNV